MSDVNFLNEVSLGKIYDWRAEKTAEITPVPFPGQDAALTDGIDTLGVIAVHTIKGRLTGSFESIQNTIYDLRRIADGLQTSALPLRSPFVNSRYLDRDAAVLDGDSASGADTVTLERRQGHIGANTATLAFGLFDANANFLTWGITTNDVVKNLVTGQTSAITAITGETSLALLSDIFPASSTSYAVTATIDVKVLSFEHNWQLPGLNVCEYSMEVMQVKE
jgi:hypothetical protein